MASAFDRWFREQYGTRPSRRRREALECAVEAAHVALMKARIARDTAAAYDLRYDACLKAWQAREKKGAKA